MTIEISIGAKPRRSEFNSNCLSFFFFPSNPDTNRLILKYFLNFRHAFSVCRYSLNFFLLKMVFSRLESDFIISQFTRNVTLVEQSNYYRGDYQGHVYLILQNVLMRSRWCYQAHGYNWRHSTCINHVFTENILLFYHSTIWIAEQWREERHRTWLFFFWLHWTQME